MNRSALAMSALLIAGGSLTACGQKDVAAPLTPAPVAITAAPAAVTSSGPVTGGGQDGSLPDTAAALAKPGVAPATNPARPAP